jgi:hypothetical protein
LNRENQLVGGVAAQLATLQVSPERPLLLVLDAHARGTDWLPPRQAPQVSVDVSMLSDRLELGFLSARLPAEQVLTLVPLSCATGQAMLRDLLALAPRRTLVPNQEEAVLTAFATHGLPLHLQLLASEARRWCSFDPPHLGPPHRGTAPPPATTPELVQTILNASGE